MEKDLKGEKRECQSSAANMYAANADMRAADGWESARHALAGTH